jgi:FAD dependent oxidoreductase
VALAVIDEMLAPHRSSGRLRVLERHRPVAAETDGDRVPAVILEGSESGERVGAHAPYVLDATELGELLELGGVEHVIGSESRRETGEPHAVEGDPRPLEQQSISWCSALDHLEGEDHTIEKPRGYDDHARELIDR